MLVKLHIVVGACVCPVAVGLTIESFDDAYKQDLCAVGDNGYDADSSSLVQMHADDSSADQEVGLITGDESKEPWSVQGVLETLMDPRKYPATRAIVVYFVLSRFVVKAGNGPYYLLGMLMLYLSQLKVRIKIIYKIQFLSNQIFKNRA